jgi:hypothetical protein
MAMGHELNYVHGMCGTPTYKSWDGAKQRCFNPNDDHYPLYGALGITMCDEWKNSFQAFYDYMGERPEGTTIDRWPDPFGDYKPGNCRWATPAEQSRNRRNAIVIPDEYGPSLMDAIEKYGEVSYPAVQKRLQKGWDVWDAIVTPPNQIPEREESPF